MSPITSTDTKNRSSTMYLYEDLARQHMRERTQVAHSMRRGHQLALARRLSRRAERVAQDARLALARSL